METSKNKFFDSHQKSGISENEKLVESLNPDEKAILPYLKLGSLSKIVEKSGLDETKVMRALQFLSNKDIVKIKSEEKKIIDLGDNGIIYMKNGLPERRLLNLLMEKNSLNLEDAKTQTRLLDNEFKAALGALKDKAMISLEKGKIILTGNKEEVIKKSLEEQLIESLPLPVNELKSEQKLAYENLKSRKDIVITWEKKQVEIELTELGEKITKQDLSKVKDLIETLTPEMIKLGTWKNKRFRRYDVTSNVPEIHGGKRHFVNQAKDYARKIWTELGFKEMNSSLTQTSFWNFDSLFQPQDHPARELADTFYIKDIKGKLPDKKLVEEVKKAHEQGVQGSKGWQYKWKEPEAEKVILRTHTTALSAKTLAMLKNIKAKKGKYFAIGKCFRNETLDWSHEFEFNQTEGIVIDKNANFLHLLGYLKEFFKKMGFQDIRFVPSYFPYTEPSLEIYGYMKEKKQWIEIGGAGMFRPEVIIPLLGEYIPVLAWGPGFDRTLMNYYSIEDLRDLYKNDLNQLRKMKVWLK